MRSFLLAFAAIMVVVLVSSPSVSNFALAKTYKSGEMPTTGNVQEIKKQMLEKARAAAEADKKKALEKLQKEPTTKKKDTTKKTEALEAAKAAVWEKAKKDLEQYKATKPKK